MNYQIIIKIQGYLLLILALALVLPTGIAWYYKEAEFLPFLYSLMTSGIVGVIMAKVNPKNKKLRLKTGILVVVCSWLSFTFFGSLPYYLGNILSLTDSVFETMSGFTTTGSTVILQIEELGRGILFWRSMTQWLGGMGIIVLSLAIMPLLGASGSVLYRSEVPGPSTDKLMPRLQATAKILWVVYVLFTAGMAVMLKILGMDWFDAICHSFTTLSTGGFSNHNASIGYFNNPAIEWTVIVFMFIGGANFSLHYGLFVSGKIKSFIKNREFVFYSLIIIIASLSISYQLGVLSHPETSLRQAFFNVISLTTSTGFVTSNYEIWGPFSQFMLFLLLFVGGCGGSTAGGVKVIRVYVVIKIALVQIGQVLHPNSVSFIKIDKTTVKETLVGKVMGFVIFYILILGIGGLILAMLGHDILTSFSAVAASLGNIGPGFGDVGPNENYFMIHDAGKWVLIFCMLAGRLELFTVLVIFSREFWRR